MRLKPRILVDLQRSGCSVFTPKKSRVNLAYSRTIKFPLLLVFKAAVVIAVFSSLIFGSVLAPIESGPMSFAAQNQEEREQLEKQLAELEAQIEQYQGTVDKYRSQGNNLKDEITRLNAKINQLNLQIKSINLNLQKLDNEIEVNQNNITTTESEIEINKQILSRSIQSLYENENQSLVEVLLANPSLAAFFDNVSNLMYVQESLRGTLEKVMGLHVQLLEDKEQLAVKKNDANTLKVSRLAQKENLDVTKKDRSYLLEVTKGQEAKYQDLVKQTQKSAAQIRSRLFQLIGGGELTFEKAYELARFAERATGIRAALLLAVLDRESALGQNVGKCSYEKAMHPTRDLPVFSGILANLKAAGIAPPEPVMVSCPNRDGYFGGAMGPAQFIPSTWALYEKRIIEITGSSPANPWSNADAFVATALYLKDALNACSSYSGTAKERCAAARYYAGSRWSKYLWAYGQPVVDRANRFQQDIDILNA